MCLAHDNNTLLRAACGAVLNCYYSKASNRLRPAAENNEDYHTPPVKSTPWLSRVASMTFGIYLCHFIFVQMGYDLYSRILPEGVPTITRILLNAVSVFALCYALVRILSTTRLTRKLVA